jgi:hypothetical protein
MDSTEYPSLGRLAVLNAQLARQSRAVEAVVDGQLDHVERLFRAAAARDWDAVLQISELLIAEVQSGGEFQGSDDRGIVRSARELCDVLRRDASAPNVSTQLAELLSACRSAKLAARQPRLWS